MEFVGKIIAALTPRPINTQRGEVVLQSFVVEEVKDQYPHKMVFDVFGQDKLDRFKIEVGQQVSVSFDIDAHEWNGRWFNSIKAFDVRQISAALNAANNAAAQLGTSPVLEAATAKLEPFAEPVINATDADPVLPF